MNIHFITEYPLDDEELDHYRSFLENQTRAKFQHFLFSGLAASHKNTSHLARLLAEIRVTSIDKKELNTNLFSAEIEYEKKRLLDTSLPSQSLYDGYEFQLILRKQWPALFAKKDTLSIFMTERKLLTFHEDNRYHLRSIILGFPCIISRTGIIEAPAKPKEFYLIKQTGFINELQNWLEQNKEKYLTLEDERLPNVIKGYLLQSVFSWLKGAAEFCEDKQCALFNSHWQEEVLSAQYNHQLCKKHKTEFTQKNV